MLFYIQIKVVREWAVLKNHRKTCVVQWYSIGWHAYYIALVRRIPLPLPLPLLPRVKNYMWMCICMCECVYVCLNVYMCMDICIYIYIWMCICEQTLKKHLQYTYTVIKPSKVIRLNWLCWVWIWQYYLAKMLS